MRLPPFGFSQFLTYVWKKNISSRKKNSASFGRSLSSEDRLPIIDPAYSRLVSSLCLGSSFKRLTRVLARPPLYSKCFIMLKVYTWPFDKETTNMSRWAQNTDQPVVYSVHHVVAALKRQILYWIVFCHAGCMLFNVFGACKITRRYLIIL